MRVVSKENIQKMEEYLDERFDISQMPQASSSDGAYYNGLVRTLAILGFDVEREDSGKHSIYGNYAN